MSNFGGDEEEEAGWSDLELDYDYNPYDDLYKSYDAYVAAKESKAVRSSPPAAPKEEQVDLYSQGMRDPMSIVFSLMNKDSKHAAVLAGVPHFKELAKIPQMEEALLFMSSLKDRKDDMLLETTYTYPDGKTAEEGMLFKVTKVLVKMNRDWVELVPDTINQIIHHVLKEGTMTLEIRFTTEINQEWPYSLDAPKIYFTERAGYAYEPLTNATVVRVTPSSSNYHWGESSLLMDVPVPFGVTPELKKYFRLKKEWLERG